MGSFEFPGRFTIRGLDALFERRTDWAGPSYDRRGKLVTEVTVRLGERCPGVLKIFQKGLTGCFARMFRGSVFRSGDTLFDALYGICARPGALAEQLFAPERRASVIASVRRIGTYVDPLIDLSRDRLLVQVSESLDHERGVLNLVATTTDFVGYVLDLGATEGISIGEAAPGKDARCPVCSAALESELIYCLGCRTPHHGDCWTYLGKCSMFGCGSTSASGVRQG